jgi:N-methylhydantoinase A/oxoprolinase/acetone carboxylase beta subunit
MLVNIHTPNNKSVQVLGIDAGGTMTDTFFLDSDGDFVVGKAQSTPLNEALGLIASSEDGLSSWGLSLGAALKQLQTGVYSGTAMLNRVVQRKGLRCGLIVNRGMEDFHRMGRAIQAYLGYAYEDRIQARRGRGGGGRRDLLRVAAAPRERYRRPHQVERLSHWSQADDPHRASQDWRDRRPFARGWRRQVL